MKFLKTIDPENVTLEMAIEILERLKASAHIIAHESPGKLKEIYEELKREKKLRNN